MTVLSDAQIRKLMQGESPFNIGAFHEFNLTPNGYDLRVGHMEVHQPNGHVSETNSTFLQPGGNVIVGTMEKLTLPNNIVATLSLRSTLARKGVLASLGQVDAGFSGNLSFTLHNQGDDALSLETGNSVVEAVFQTLGVPADSGYAQRSGTYQGQEGVTGARDER